MAMNYYEKPGPILLALAAMVLASASQRDAGFAVRRFVAEDIPLEGEGADEAVLALPVSVAVSAEEIYVADAQDCALKVFSKKGRFTRALGRKGKGKGQLWFPSGVFCRHGELYVADKLNFRIQILDSNGKYIGGFGLPFAPDKVFALGPDKILVTHNPMGRPGGENILHVFSRSGVLLWEGLPAEKSGDRVFDTFLNSILVNLGGRDDFYVIHRCEERAVLHYGGEGNLLGRIPVDGRYGFKTMLLPTPGPRKTLRGFCWDSDFSQNRLFILAPDATGGRDLGPGRTIFVFHGSGRLESLIDLPVHVAKIAVDGERIYAVDSNNTLRIFRIVR